MSELPLKEWIVIFYPTTGNARLCPTLDFARNVISEATFFRHVYKSPNDFRVKHDHATLEKCWRLLYKSVSWRFPKTAVGNLEDYSPEPPDCSTEEFAKLFWEFIQDVGDRLSQPRLDTMVKVKENYEFKLSAMRELILDEEAFKEKYNKQARTVFKALADYDEQFVTEDQIKKIIFTLVAERQLKTKQKPWVIFQYYRPQFIKDGYVIRGRPR